MSTARPASPVLQRLRRLARRRSSRSEEGCYLVDGPVLVAEALAAGVALECACAEADADPVLLGALRAAGVEVVDVPEGSLRKALDLVNPQPVVAVARQAPAAATELVSLAASRGRPLVVLVGIQDPGNAGTLVRVTEAAGGVGLLLGPGCVDPWNPKAVRAAAGALFRVPVAVGVEPAAVLSDASSAGLPVAATVGRGGVAPEDTPLSGGCVVLVGSESHGLPPELVEAAGIRLSVPMDGAVESLNAAVAGAVVLFEAARQRRARAGQG